MKIGFKMCYLTTLIFMGIRHLWSEVDYTYWNFMCATMPFGFFELMIELWVIKEFLL